MKYNRLDYKTAIPQMEKEITQAAEELEKVKGEIEFLNTIEALSPTYNVTSGSDNVSVIAKRCGNIVQIRISFGIYETSAGSNMAEGTIDGLPKPVSEIKAVAYNGSTVGIMSLSTSLGVTVRVNEAVTTDSSSFIFGFTYLTDE